RGRRPRRMIGVARPCSLRTAAPRPTAAATTRRCPMPSKTDDARTRQLFAEAVQVPGPRRPTFLASACGADDALRARVEALLAAHDGVGQLFAGDAPTP